MIRRTMMLRPMQAGVSGYARLQCESGCTLVQLHARGLAPGRARLFWYLSDRAAREVASGEVNAHGELSLEAEFWVEPELVPEDFTVFGAFCPDASDELSAVLSFWPTADSVVVATCASVFASACAPVSAPLCDAPHPVNWSTNVTTRNRARYFFHLIRLCLFITFICLLPGCFCIQYVSNKIAG